MSEKINLKELERKAWRSYFDDGLWDIYLGLLLASMGVSGLLDRMELTEAWRMGIYIGLLVVVMGGFFLGKRFLTVPRIGRVKFGRERKARRIKTALVLFASVVLGLVVMLVLSAAGKGAAQNVPWNILMPAVWAVNMLVVFGAMGYFMDYERLYFIGLLYAIPIPLDAIVRAQTGLRIGVWLFFAFGLAIACTGLVYLVRFLRTYPRVPVDGQMDQVNG